jgi:hypothetical protein
VTSQAPDFEGTYSAAFATGLLRRIKGDIRKSPILAEGLAKWARVTFELVQQAEAQSVSAEVNKQLARLRHSLATTARLLRKDLEASPADWSVTDALVTAMTDTPEDSYNHLLAVAQEAEALSLVAARVIASSPRGGPQTKQQKMEIRRSAVDDLGSIYRDLTGSPPGSGVGGPFYDFVTAALLPVFGPVESRSGIDKDVRRTAKRMRANPDQFEQSFCA